MRAIQKFLLFLRGKTETAIQASREISPPGFYFMAGWNWSDPKGILPALSKREYKLRFFFDEAELALLDTSPFLLKFKRNRNPEKCFQFLGYAYPAVGETEKDLERFGQKFRDFQIVRRLQD